MNKLLIFGGASEEHSLLKALEPLPVAVTLSVASAYGRALLPAESSRFRVHTGRMDEKQITTLLREGGFLCVIDATHPYAVEVSGNIRRAAAQAGLPCLRLLRGQSDYAGCLTVESVEAAAAELNKSTGAVLLTTGSKQLAAFAAAIDDPTRLYARVLPTAEAIASCRAAGLPAGHIIAMQGPFSAELNAALLRQFHIAALVTKDGGAAGGFAQKLTAARELGVAVIVIRRPAETGLTEREIIQRVLALMEEQA